MNRKAGAVKQGGEKWRFAAKGSVDPYFLGLTIILLAVGLVMLFSASYVYAYYNDGDSMHYLKRQAIFAVSGLVVMWIVSKVNYGWFKALTYPALAVAFLLLVVVLFLPPLPDTPDFKRWIYIPGMARLGTFQPSELAKVALVMFCAFYAEKHYKATQEKHFGFLPYAAVILPMALLIFKENHVSGTVLILAIGIVMMYLAGVKKYWFAIGVGLVAVVLIAVFAVDNEVLQKIIGENAANRILAFKDKSFDPTGLRWQTNQSVYAIASGGFFGTGLGKSMQKHLYVSEPQNDFIFSIVCEELGFFGACVIITLFALLVWRGVVIALKAKDKFSCLLVLGIVFHIALQVALNIAVVTDSIPNTGIPLPFFSYGGTALWVLLAEMGMVLSVSRSANIQKV